MEVCCERNQNQDGWIALLILLLKEEQFGTLFVCAVRSFIHSCSSFIFWSIFVFTLDGTLVKCLRFPHLLIDRESSKIPPQPKH